MPAQYTGPSVVDYLSSVGKDSSYGNRANIYKTAGLNMGEYTGNANQNTALLNYLKGSSGSNQPASTPVIASPTPGGIVTTTPQPSPRTNYVEQVLQGQQAEKQKYDTVVNQNRQKLIDFYSKLESSTDRFNRLRTENGVAEQEGLVNALTKQAMQQTDLVEAIPDSVNARTGNFFVTEGDRTAIVAREQEPVINNLNKILRNKQYEEIGLAGKQQLVKELLSLSLQDDEMKAKPLVMGVDYSEKDRATAMELLQSMNQQRIGAFSADQDTTDRKTAADTEWQRSLEKLQKQFDMDKEMNAIKFNNDVKLTNMSKSNSNANKAADEEKKMRAAKTEAAFNSIVGDSNTEWDAWNYINSNSDRLRAEGIDVDELWRQHAALKAKVGAGGAIRETADDELGI